MKQYHLTPARISAYGAYLRREERARGTVEKYLRDLETFARWLEDAPVTKEAAAAWKAHLCARGYAPATVNSMLAALNGCFAFLGWEGLGVKPLKLQRRLFREPSRELTRPEYERLIGAARGLGRERLALLIEAMGSTGVRVSEVRYLTVEAAQRGRAEISMKGKIRTILLPGRLCRKLLKYARKNKIASGEIFLTRSGRSLSRRQIWAELKRLCKRAGVEPGKVFPHNLRHMFATAHYRAYKDVVRLADLLGHSSVETTRIYLVSSGLEHARQLDRLGLVS